MADNSSVSQGFGMGFGMAIALVLFVMFLGLVGLLINAYGTSFLPGWQPSWRPPVATQGAVRVHPQNSAPPGARQCERNGVAGKCW